MTIHSSVKSSVIKVLIMLCLGLARVQAAPEEEPLTPETATPETVSPTSRQEPPAPPVQQPQQPQQVAKPAPPPALNPLTLALGNAGVVHCQAHIQQVADFLTKGADSAVSLMLPPDHINDHMISSSMEVFDGRTLFYANMDLAPLVAYGCDTSFETVMYWPANCDLVAKTQFKGTQNNGKMKHAILFLSYGPSLQIYLMPAGPGCVSIKKQGIFDKF